VYVRAAKGVVDTASKIVVDNTETVTGKAPAKKSVAKKAGASTWTLRRCCA